MATHQQVQQTTVFPGRVWAGVAKAIADLGYGLSRGLSTLGTQRAGAVRAGTVMDTRVAPRPSDLFVQALRDDSNQEMDWLWLYTQVSRTAERRYCLDRALAINPDSEMARAEYSKL